MRIPRIQFTMQRMILAVAVVAVQIWTVTEVIRPPVPKAVLLGSPVFEFGVMPQNVNGKHPWVIRNQGNAPLRLALGCSSCNCTADRLRNDLSETVPPGGQTTVSVLWNTRTYSIFRGVAQILTNDLENPTIELRVNGVAVPVISGSRTGVGTVTARL